MGLLLGLGIVMAQVGELMLLVRNKRYQFLALVQPLTIIVILVTVLIM
jgi:hypothetical protein